MILSAPRIVRRPSGAPGCWPDEVPPLLRRLYEARGATGLDQARPRLAALLPPCFGQLDRAVALLVEAIASGWRIVVVGDFDCDGATACAVAVRGLRLLGAREVLPAVPNRRIHGYGLSPALVEELAALHPQLLVTVDAGIACVPGVAAAKARGWQVLVTDHHLPGPVLPAADAILDPNLPGDPFPSKALAGVGVMFYLLLALRAQLRRTGQLGRPEPDLGSLLDLVAVGTVADLVALDVNNRALVAAGLRRLRQGQGCVGLQALIESSGRDPARLTAGDIGYALAPRLNAAGRLEDMAIGIELLLSDQPTQARAIAAELEAINGERRALQQTMTAEAEAAVERVLAGQAAQLPKVACFFDADWHPGVVGLVASKMKERLHRPVLAFAPVEPGSAQLRGSARSVPGFHIRDALAAVDAAHPGLIERFGGHAMAAGLSLPRSALDEFRQALQAVAETSLDAALLHAELVSDGPLQPQELDFAHAQALRLGGPWGQGFPEPLFDDVFEVLDWRVLKARHLKLGLRLPGREAPLAAIQFDGWTGQPPPSRLQLAYRLVTDDYRGGEAIQLIVECALPA